MFRKLFGRKAAAKPAAPSVPETGTLRTKFGEVNMNRVALKSGAVAYLCHTADKPENTALDIDRIECMAKDRNHGTVEDKHNVMSEQSPYGGKSDFAYAAENICNHLQHMDEAMVVVFFDHLDRTLESDEDILKQLRGRFPASNPVVDRMERPEKPKPRKAQDSLARPSQKPSDFGMPG